MKHHLGERRSQRYMIRHKMALREAAKVPLLHEGVDWMLAIEEGCKSLSVFKTSPEKAIEITRRYDRLLHRVSDLAHCATQAQIFGPQTKDVEKAFLGIDEALKEMHEYIGSVPTTQQFLPSRKCMQETLPSIYGVMTKAAQNAPTPHIQQLRRMRHAAQRTPPVSFQEMLRNPGRPEGEHER